MRLQVLIFLYLSGYLVFTKFADFDSVDEKGLPTRISLIWSDAYYIWQPLIFMLSWWCILGLVKGKDKRMIICVFIFSILMLLWDVIRVLVGINNNNQWVVMAAFLAALGVTVFLTFRQGKKLGI